jgi:PAS domain S-box-containing protein
MIASKLTTQAVRAAAGNKKIAIRPLAVVAWSGNMSFSSPESDFYVSAVRQEPEVSAPVWSGALSFASPENDFTFVDAPAVVSHGEVWSSSLSFASPEADFAANPEAPDWEWSENLSFASPEADFVSRPEEAPAWEWSENLSFSSPEADFQATSFRELRAEEPSVFADLVKSPVMGLAIASPESASGAMHAHHYLESHHMYQLHQRQTAEQDVKPLPTTLQDALSADESRAIVVTEAHTPFQIVDVNDAWVGLCGFSKEEARHSSLNLIQGTGTNTQALDFMLQDLLHGQESQTLVTNYTKTGRKFYNMLRAGPIRDANDTITHFVGVLTEVHEEPDYFRMES